jgi:hypothetical protein
MLLTKAKMQFEAKIFRIDSNQGTAFSRPPYILVGGLETAAPCLSNSHC